MNNREKDFQSISIVIKTDRFGTTVLSNTREGLIEYKYIKHDRHFKRILAVPVILVGIYEKSDTRYYKLKLNGKTVCLTQLQLIDYIQENNLFYVSGRKLKDSIDLILRALEKRNGIKPKKR